MARRTAARLDGIDLAILIKAPPGRILKAFFDADALGAWWQTLRSVTTPRPLGVYAVEWLPTDFRDDMFGRLGGVFRGTVMAFDPGRGFFVADAFWLPPDSEPVGPMTLDVTCLPVHSSDENTSPEELTTEVRVKQNGFEDSPRWRRYYELVEAGWGQALTTMKMLLEK